MLQLWNPLPWRFGKEFQPLQRETDRWFEDLSSHFPRLSSRKDVDFVPACDVEETDSNYLISLDIPGMKKEELKVDFSNNVLTISGEHKEEKREEKKNRRLTERYQGSFERCFHFPDVSVATNIEANYSDGVLRISVPKVATSQKKQIHIGEGKSAPKVTVQTPKSAAA